MYPTSAAFKTAISGDHVVIAKAEVWSSDRKLLTLDIDTGSVKVTTSNAIRRTCEVHLTTERETTNLVPDDGFDYLVKPKKPAGTTPSLPEQTIVTGKQIGRAHV